MKSVKDVRLYFLTCNKADVQWSSPCIYYHFKLQNIYPDNCSYVGPKENIIGTKSSN